MDVELKYLIKRSLNDPTEHLYELIDAGKVESTYDSDKVSGQHEDK